MAPKLRRYAMDEVKGRWATLLPEHRQAFMSFEDPFLVERIKCALQALFEKQMMMSHLGLMLGDSPDPFASSHLFTTAFEFTWHIGRSRSNPSVTLVDPASMPIMAMKLPFLQSVNFFQDLQCILPDFLSLRSGRSPLPRARWKEIWAVEPSSVVAMEQSLVKLVEQALWNMMSKPDCNLAIPEASEPLPSEPVPLEAWMVDEDRPSSERSSQKKKKKGKRKSPAKVLETTIEEGLGDAASDADAGDLDAVERVSSERLPDGAASDDEQEIDISSDADESVCMGTFHVEGEASDISRDPTASSTPATGFGNSKPVLLPPVESPKLAPPELVCYLWSQTAQFGQQQEGDAAQPATAEPTSPATTCTPKTIAMTPFSVGQRFGVPMPETPSSSSDAPRIVVKNTFVDIDDPEERPSRTRASRSLSPPRLRAGRDEDWEDPWCQ